ncbi:MAG: ATP-binding protein [Rhodospirillales bacterium]|nr:ATP-binding protein [Rhodospirillales bacterium]
MKIGLSAKIIGVFLLVSLCFFPPLAYFSISKNRETLEHAFLERAKTIAHLLDASVRSEDDLESSEKLFLTIQKNIWLDPDILEIDINLPADGRLATFVSSRAERVGRPADAENLSSYEQAVTAHRIVERSGARQLVLSAPIHSAKHQLGTIQIELTLENVDRMTREATNIAIASYFALVIAFVSVIFLFLRGIVIRPIKRLSRSVQKFARGDADHRLELRSNDEIGQLAAAFNQMTTDLEQTNEQLRQSQKMEAIGQLTGGVAHDFNNLLAVILGNAELLDLRSRDNKSLVQAIIRAATRGEELTYRLLAFSRQQPLQPRSIDLAALVAGMSDILERALGEMIEIETITEQGLWMARADAGQVENTLLNLANNARDAMIAGGKLRIECANVRGDETTAAQTSGAMAGDYVMLAVTDTGVGMAEAVLERAFEPFFTTKDVGEGSGLGLSMVYGFAKQSKGHVTIDSKAGKGTAVKLYLPRSNDAAVQAGRAMTEQIPHGRGEVVLVIEDDPDVRELAAGILDSLGYRVITAPTVDSARTVLKKNNRIDLVLSDVVLPAGTSGPAFAREARAQRPDLKVVFMSGYVGEAVTRNGLPEPDTVLLSKPFQRHEMAEALRSALDGT